ncbi:MAG: Carboxylesterase type [Acidimicrobiales bacterium]|nr:Carboxylesterase type [Acidimicrobiales bacterium]
MIDEAPCTATDRRSTAGRRGTRWATLASVLAAALLVAGCDALPPPAGAAPLRYRDAVFATVKVTKDQQYGSAPDLKSKPVALKLDVFEPSGDKVAKRPAVVWVHGGGFSGGDKGTSLEASYAATFAKLGYVAVNINYRLLSHGCNGSGGVTTECYNAAVAAIHDGQAAVRWLRANAAKLRIDPTRIGIGGSSAGAIVATGVGIWADQPGSSGSPGFSSKVGAFVSISGGVPGGTFVDATDAPGELFSGTADPIVPYQWSVDTAKALTKAKVFNVFKPLPGAGHVPVDKYADLFTSQSQYFFYDLLDLGHAAR